MVVVCQVAPAENLSPDQLQQLATALADWCRAESGRRTDVAVELDGHGLGDLRQGNYPRPLAQRMAAATGYDLAQVEAYLGAEASSRGIEMRIHCDDRDGVAASLKQSLSAELVGEVLVDGRPWDDPAPMEG